MVHAAPLFGAVPGQVAPPLLVLVVAALPVLAAVVVSPAPVPVLTVALPPLPMVVVAVPVPAPPTAEVPVEVTPAPAPLGFWLTEPPQASTMARNVIPKEAMAAVLFMSLSKLGAVGGCAGS